MGRIFDDRGNRMSPSHSRKGGSRHRYYVSSALIHGQPKSAGSVARVPAAKVEAVVVDAVRRHIGQRCAGRQCGADLDVCPVGSR